LNPAKKTIAMAHKTWLVGVGAYDSGREKAADKIDQLFVESSQFVNELLEKGESIETQIQEKLEARKMLKDKISALKAKLGFGNENRDQQIDMLTQRVDSLIEVVAKLAQQKAAEKKATTTKKAPAKKAAKPAAKATATKATAKTAAKPAAKTTATKAPAKTATKPAAKAAAKKAPAKAAAKPTAKATVTKAPAKTEVAPASEVKAEPKD
jgi:polyhydroxyalkanoate synthesis regulator phasin